MKLIFQTKILTLYRAVFLYSICITKLQMLMRNNIHFLSSFFFFLLISLNSFSQAKLIPFEEKGKFGFKDAKSGKQIVEPKYDKASSFVEGMCAVKSGLTWGYVNEKGQLVIPMKFQDARDFAQGLACVRLCDDNKLVKGCKYGYVDKTGKTAILFEFDDARDFKEGLAGVQADKNGPWCFINGQGKCEIKPKYQIANSFQKGIAVVKVNGKFGTIDIKGNSLIPPVYDNLTEISLGIYQAKKESKFGFIRANGKEIVAFGKYDKLTRPFDKGVAVVEKIVKQPNVAIALIDTSGREIIPLGKYSSIGKFGANDLASASRIVDSDKNKGAKLLRFGYINRMGQETIPFEFEKADDFVLDSALVKKGGKSFYINSLGKCLRNCPEEKK